MRKYLFDKPNLHTKYHLIEQRWSIPGPTASGIVAYYQDLYLTTRGLRFDERASFRRDKRTDDDFLYDLCDGWCCEDLVGEWLPTIGYEAKRTGCDRKRVVQIDTITTEPDFEGLEVQFCDRNLAYFGLKKNKGDRMMREGHHCITIIPPIDRYFITTPEQLIGKKTFINKRLGNKECYMLVPLYYNTMIDGRKEWPE